MELADLSLYKATPEQKMKSRRNTHTCWPRGLSIEQYLHRESLLETYQHAVDGKLTIWVLAPRSDPTTLDFLCSCETYRRTGARSSAEGDSAEEIPCYSIASVFTPAQNRRKGYGRHMMRLLHWVLAPSSSLPPFPSAWGSPPPMVSGFNNAQFSVLYSDVGPSFYEKCGPTLDSAGWVVRDHVSTTWQVLSSPSIGSTPGEPLWLSEQSVSELLEIESLRMKKDLLHIGAAVTFLPNDGVNAYQVKLFIRFPEADVSKPQLPLSTWGVALPEDDATFATWTADSTSDPAAPTLIITRLRATKETFPTLLILIKQFASRVGLNVVEAWNLPVELLEACDGVCVTKERDDHLPGFMWYGDGSGSEVKWVFNERFAWC